MSESGKVFEARVKRIFAALVICLTIGGDVFARQGPGGRGGGAGREWKLAFELAFGEGSPYGGEFPDLYKLPYGVNRAITKEVLDRLVGVALKETRARRVRLAYGPGGYRDFPVVPSAQLEVEATDGAARALMNVVGYLAQQTSVIASKVVEPGNRRAVRITETSGRRLADPKTVEAFWHRLAAASPKLQPGFSFVETAGGPGLYIIDSEGDWLAEDFPGFGLAAAQVSKEFGIRTAFADFSVEYVEQGNDWKTNRGGEEYLGRLEAEGGAGLRRRLETVYRPRVRRWIRRAFERHAPEALRRHEGRDKRAASSRSTRLSAPRVFSFSQGLRGFEARASRNW